MSNEANQASSQGMKRFQTRMSSKRVFPVVLAFILLAQLVPIEKDNPPVQTEPPMPAEVKSILKRACYDCHSHETAWPWYSSIAPVSWLVSHDVHEAREELDFSAWNRIEKHQRAKKLKNLRKEVEEREMPPWYYQIMHPEAHLSMEDHRILDEWAACTGIEYSRVRDEK